MGWLWEQVADLTDRLARRRHFQVWEAALDGDPFCKTADRLTRDEALAMADDLAMRRHRLRMLVLDGRGQLVYRVYCPTGSRAPVRGGAFLPFRPQLAH